MTSMIEAEIREQVNYAVRRNSGGNNRGALLVVEQSFRQSIAKCLNHVPLLLEPDKKTRKE